MKPSRQNYKASANLALFIIGRCIDGFSYESLIRRKHPLTPWRRMRYPTRVAGFRYYQIFKENLL